jgi:hypothetical protein
VVWVVWAIWECNFPCPLPFALSLSQCNGKMNPQRESSAGFSF